MTLERKTQQWLNRLREDSLVKMVDPDLPANKLPFEKPVKRSEDSWVEGFADGLEAALYFYSHSMADPRHARNARMAFEMCAKSFDDKHFGYSRDRCFMRVNGLLVDLCTATDLAGRQNILIEIENTLISEKADDEPIAKDTLAYLKVCFGLQASGSPAEVEQAVQETILRFPGLLGAGAPGPDHHDWRPPILMRGALMMVPTPRAPLPIELGIETWTPCP